MSEREADELCRAVLALLIVIRSKQRRDHPPYFPEYDELVERGKLT